MDSVQQVLQTLAEGLRSLAERIDSEVAAGNGHRAPTLDTDAEGEKLGLRDTNGKPLRIGDYVRVTGSDRYGTTHGFVVGPAESHDHKDRVTVALASGENDDYTPSVGRVTRIRRADR